MEFKNYFKKNGYKFVTEVLLEIVIVINFAIYAAVYDWFGFDYSKWIMNQLTMEELYLISRVSIAFAVGFLLCNVLSELHNKWNKED